MKIAVAGTGYVGLSVAVPADYDTRQLLANDQDVREKVYTRDLYMRD